MTTHLLWAAVGAAFGWSVAMFVVWLRDGGIVEFWRVKYVDNSGESM